MSNTKPVVSIPEGSPPSDLEIEDIEEGEGEAAAAGRSVDVHYTGVAWSTAKEFDSSWGRGEPFSFELGRGQVIEGWDAGVIGMRIGGRRRLTIPPHMAYGTRGVGGGVIAPNETLVFVVDLIAVS